MTSGSSKHSPFWYLALETSIAQTSLCLMSSSGAILEKQIEQSDSHSEALALGVRDLIDAAGVTPRQLGAIVVASGPGSFTGLRIGFSFAKGFALSLQCPLLAVSSLAAAAYEFLPKARLVCVMRDARRDELFWQVFLRDNQSLMTSIDGPAIVAAKDVALLVAAHAEKFSVAEDEIALVSSDDLTGYGLSNLKPKHGARCALELWRSMGRAVPPFDLNELIALEPSYMRAVAAKTIAERLNS